MTIVGFGFNKIEVEKSNPIKGKVSVSNNIKIDNVEETTMNMGNQKQKILKFVFNYKTTYSNDVGHLEITGELYYLNDKKTMDDVMKKWKNSEKLSQEVTRPVINTILNKSTILALSLSSEVNLPPQVNLPKVKVDQ
ncbi:MAG: hypothetical protein ACOCZQ_00645 [Nanoarchaeota archaeon]